MEVNVIRTQIQLTEEQSEMLKAISQKKGVSMAELIRQSIDSFIRASGELSLDKKRQRALAVVGQFRADITDLSTDHDHYLAEAYGGSN